LQLEKLDLSLNSLKNGINPIIGRLRHLKKLDLNQCKLKDLPDKFGDLEAVGILSKVNYQSMLEPLKVVDHYHYLIRKTCRHDFTDG